MQDLIPSSVRRKKVPSSSYDSSFELLSTYNPDLTTPDGPSRSTTSTLVPSYNVDSSSTYNVDTKSTTEEDPRHSSSSSPPPADLPPCAPKLPPRPPLPPKTLPPTPFWTFWRTHILVFAVIGTTFSLLIWGTSQIPPLVTYTTRAPSCQDLNATTSLLDPDYILQSNLTFAQAKMIDIAWDFGVGQGGRIIMGWVTYIVAMDALVRIMEKGRVGYEVYMAVAFATPRAWSVWVILKSLVMGWENWARGGWRMKTRAKVVLVTLLVCVIWVLCFPTFSAAVTSYTARSQAYWTMPNGDLLNSTANVTRCAVVNDGGRIGLKDGEVLQGPPVGDIRFHPYTLRLNITDAVENGTVSINETDKYPIYISGPPSYWRYEELCMPIPVGSDWANYGALWNYTRKYVLSFGGQDLLSAAAYAYLSNVTMDPWTLADYKNLIPLDLIYPTNITIAGTTYPLSSPALNIDILFQDCYQSRPLPTNWGTAFRSCVNRKGFEWGFSSILLTALLGGQALWVLVLYCLYIDANLNSVLLRHGRRVRGELRSIADLAEAVQEDLGRGACGYGEGELRKAVRGRGVRFFVDDGGPGRVGHVGVSSRRLEPIILRRGWAYGGKGE